MPTDVKNLENIKNELVKVILDECGTEETLAEKYAYAIVYVKLMHECISEFSTHIAEYTRCIYENLNVKDVYDKATNLHNADDSDKKKGG